MSTTRRAFVQGVAATGAAVALRPLAARELEPQAKSKEREPQVVPVIGFFMDQPYLDWSGQAQPYVPPDGLRSAG